jgi:predicted N-acyltransferase
MNARNSKALRRKAEDLLISWIRIMVPEGEDATKITKKNLHEFLPEQTHIFANNRFMLSAYSLRWFYKQVKKNPNITLEDLNA